MRTNAMQTGVLALALLAGSSAAQAPGAGATTANTTYRGVTDQDRNLKLVADSQGRVVRGAATVLTDCDGRYKAFRARLELRSPLDRSTQDGFRDVGSRLESDDEFSARYRHEIEGEYASSGEIEGTLSLEVVFRKSGEEYVTCEASEVSFTVKEVKDKKLQRG